MHDSEDKTWRHLDFFQHRAFGARSGAAGALRRAWGAVVAVPWVRPGSGFTMLFEALVLTFAAAMPMTRVAALELST